VVQFNNDNSEDLIVFFAILWFIAVMDKELWKKIAVIGAAGKMGRGISLILLQEMARLEAEETGSVGTGTYRLTVVDTYGSNVFSLKKFLRPLVTSYAEKNINSLRNYFSKNSKLISNGEIIEAFVEGSMDILQPTTELADCKEARLVFEAIHEDLSAKTTLYNKLKQITKPETYFFSNTSSIPIHILNEASDLKGKIIGCHFYNPPHIQRLVEIIPLKGEESNLSRMTQEIARQLNKIVVYSNDIAGFIGNGHFLREVQYACSRVDALAGQFPSHQAIFLLNRVTQDYLIRPMGIFQLIDYVGIDICKQILSIMRTYVPDNSLEIDLINKMMKLGKKGGQNPDGTQKDGFFHYEGLQPLSVFSLEDQTYLPLETSWLSPLGEMPSSNVPWKTLHKIKDKRKLLSNYFEQLFHSETWGAKVAIEFLKESKKIADKLVQDRVATSMEDIKTVLENGFFHLYGPEDPFKIANSGNTKTEAIK
jgi:3-hydroxyacyl-CoA dehydrogenase